MSAPNGRLTPEQQRQVEANLGLVYKVARRFERQGREAGHDVEDLAQEGTLGLMRAAQSYDEATLNPATGAAYAFSTWAVAQIQFAILRCIYQRNGLVAVDWRVYARGERVQAASLDRAIGRDGQRNVVGRREGEEDNTLAARIPDPTVDVEGDVTARVADEELAARLVRLVNGGVLTPGEAYVLARLAGLLPPPDPRVEDRPHKMLTLIARERGVSRERIRQLRNAGMAKLAPYLAAWDTWDSPERVRVLSSAVAATTRRAAQKTTKPADTAPKPAKRSGAHATGVSSTSNSSELSQPSVQRFKRTGTPRRAKNSTNAA